MIHEYSIIANYQKDGEYQYPEQFTSEKLQF